MWYNKYCKLDVYIYWHDIELLYTIINSNH